MARGSALGQAARPIRGGDRPGIRVADKNSTLRYTLDGSEPDASNALRRANPLGQADRGAGAGVSRWLPAGADRDQQLFCRRKTAFPIASISTDPGNLFDPDRASTPRAGTTSTARRNQCTTSSASGNGRPILSGSSRANRWSSGSKSGCVSTAAGRGITTKIAPTLRPAALRRSVFAHRFFPDLDWANSGGSSSATPATAGKQRSCGMPWVTI